MPVPFWRRLSRAILGFALLLLAAVQLASAQPLKERHNIHVFSPDTPEQSEMCYYRIDEQTDQDVLRIAPQGIVRFYTDQGLWVNIEVQDDARGRSGTPGDGRVNLRRGRPVAQLAVREAIGESTEHKISIRCCMGRSPNACTNNWIEAQPYAQDLGMRGIGEDAWLGMTPRTSPRGPNAMDGIPATRAPSSTPMPGGGPMMEIEEN